MQRFILLATSFLACSAIACSSPTDGGQAVAVDGAYSFADGQDGGAKGDAGTGAGADAGTEAGAAADAVADTGTDAGTPVDAVDAVDVEDAPDEFDNGLDPPDVDAGAVDVGPKDAGTLPKGLGTLYAHTSGTLYRLDPAGFAKVADFKFDKNSGEMTDIALDKNGGMYGVTFNDLFKCDTATAKCQWLAGLPTSFNGLTFVPAGTVKPNDEALIGVGNDGSWNLLDVVGTKASVKNLGYYGGGLTSSGDAFSVEGVGTFATVKAGFSGDDSLASINPKTGAATVIGNTGVSNLWGFAWYDGTFYGFSSDGSVYSLDVKTAAATSAKFPVPGNASWWGAGVSTRAASK